MTDRDRALAEELAAAFVAAFPHYVRSRLVQLGVVAGERVEAAIPLATADLEVGLAELLSEDPENQSRSPLELVRSATHALTTELAAMGLRPPRRDEWLTDQYPKDIYDLYPASSQSLGEEAWRLHLEWGKAKALTVAGVAPATEAAPALPTVAIFGVPTEERDPIIDAVNTCGYRTAVWRNPAALEQAESSRPVLVVVDLRHPDAHDAIRTLTAKGVRVIAAGPEVNDLTVPGLMALGAEEVISSASVAARLSGLLPRLA